MADCSGASNPAVVLCSGTAGHMWGGKHCIHRGWSGPCDHSLAPNLFCAAALPKHSSIQSTVCAFR